MRVLLVYLLSGISLIGFSQSSSIFGIYKLDNGSPSNYYLKLDCDSSFHFITHYDLGGQKSYSPELKETFYWKLADDSTLLIDEFIFNISFFNSIRWCELSARTSVIQILFQLNLYHHSNQ